MTTFLQYVAKDILAKHGLDGMADTAVVFPNKRASLFLNQALYAEAGRPVWSPSYFTISDFFRHHSTLTVPDQIELVFRLYNTYVSVTGNDEPLDHFFSWGQLMLADFDDLDKNLVDADKLFINLEAWQEMRDYSFLSEQQRKSLEDFFGKVATDTALQKRFNDIWKQLGPVYRAFRDSLAKDGLAYEGMLYRDVVERGLTGLHYKHYIFVGFNLLQKVEQRLFRQLMDMGVAEFYWDYDKYYLSPEHEAGRYIRQYLDKFPNELSPERASADIDTDEVYDNFSKAKDITYASAPTEDIQARYVSAWLRQCKSRNPQFEAEANQYAIVLADERLLQNVIHCLPEEISDVNITTGYPLSASPAATLVNDLIVLRLNGLTKDGDHYRLAQVNRLLRHPYARYISDDLGALYEELNAHKTYYPSRSQLTDGRDEATALLFTKFETADGTVPLLPWMAAILQQAGLGARESEEPLTQESIFRMYTLIHRLDGLMTVTVKDSPSTVTDGGRQTVSVTVLQRLLGQLTDATTIPFHGEPALGVQIMGVLETRNLDFAHVLVLSCNEGNLPRGVDDASFIPHSLRRGYEMTTIENKVAIYSYYFHSLLQRASDATLTYNNATSDGRQGEMSRFMLQYMVGQGTTQPIRRITLQSGQSVTPISRTPVEKAGTVAEKLNAVTALSPTAINRYLRCNLQFYYATICGLYEPDDNEEDEIDNATFGNIFHRTAELIYRHLSGEGHATTITSEAIDSLMKDGRHIIDGFIDQAFREKLFQVDDPSYRPRYNGLQLLNRNVIRLYILRLLRLDRRDAPFDILALEQGFYDKLTFRANGAERTINVGGQIDRLDKISRQGRRLIRVIDYKTGRPMTSSAPDIDEIFSPEYVDTKHTAYYLQSFLYASIIRESGMAQASVNKDNSPVAPALLFIRQASGDDYDPILRLKDKGSAGRRATYSTVNDIADVAGDYRERLQALLGEIFDTSVPFRPTTHEERCAGCPYQNICGL